MHKTISKEHKQISLENNFIEAVFNTENGALIAFVNEKNGRQYQGFRSLAQAFQMVIPLPERLLNLVNESQQRTTLIEEEYKSRQIYCVQNSRTNGDTDE